MTWRKGSAEVEQLLSEGKLDRVSGKAADGHALLVSAERLLESAGRERQANPEAAYVLSYDAARKACAALLAQQGLRTVSTGHHVTTELVVRAQFGGPFDGFGMLRRRRTEIEYPRFPGDDVSAEEATEALEAARAILHASQALIEELPLFARG